jgi:2-amino-4-hydroxy-6-hydroxymethyldihydropteridine diphosphokinase
VALGSNLGDPEATLAAAVQTLAALPDVRLRGVSRLYATAPVGVTDQPEFRNAVVALDVPRGADDATGAMTLLLALKSLERAFGRRRRERWGPRELDLDLIAFGRWAGAVTDPIPLVVPHPAAHDRLFVLAPLADVAPRTIPPGWGETVARAAARRRAAEGPDAVRAVADWGGDGWRAVAQPR